MIRTLITSLAGLGLAFAAQAQPLAPLDDAELGQVSGADGISIAMELNLNKQAATDPTIDRRTWWGFKDGDKTTYLVVKNMQGSIGMYALKLDVHQRPDGGDYVAVGLPHMLHYKDFGFESMSVQSDPMAPVTGNLGSFRVNGNLNMQGELRIWAH